MLVADSGPGPPLGAGEGEVSRHVARLAAAGHHAAAARGVQEAFALSMNLLCMNSEFVCLKRTGPGPTSNILEE